MVSCTSPPWRKEWSSNLVGIFLRRTSKRTRSRQLSGHALADVHVRLLHADWHQCSHKAKRSMVDPFRDTRARRHRPLARCCPRDCHGHGSLGIQKQQRLPVGRHRFPQMEASSRMKTITSNSSVSLGRTDASDLDGAYYVFQTHALVGGIVNNGPPNRLHGRFQRRAVRVCDNHG